MHKFLFACALALVWSAAACATAERLWLGEFTLRGQSTPVVLHEPEAGSDATASVDLPAMGARGVPLTKFERTPQRVRFQLDGPTGRLEFSAMPGKATLSGDVKQGDARGTFTLVETVQTTPAIADAHAGSYQAHPDT